MAIYYFMGVVRDAKTEALFKGVWPFVALQLAAIPISIAFPDTVMLFVRALTPAR